MEQLFGMANMLQSALDREEANEVLRGKAQYLLPEFSGALYVFNNSRDRLDRGFAHRSVQGAAFEGRRSAAVGYCSSTD